jgi:hypothetical protein
MNASKDLEGNGVAYLQLVSRHSFSETEIITKYPIQDNAVKRNFIVPFGIT